LLLGVILTSCEKYFDYSPYAINFSEDECCLNEKNIEEILGHSNNTDTIRIAFTGDTHRYFDELDQFVESVNQLNNQQTIDFVVHVGDIADFGLPKQYLWGNSYLQKLHCPYIVTLGNHDLVGNGGDAYTEMYGAYNFSFISKRVKFVFINTNGREFGFNGNVPDISWLDRQLHTSSDFDNAIVIFHVPPMDVDFDRALEDDFRSAIAKYSNVLLAIHGHLHHFELYQPYADSINYLNVYGVENHKYNVVTISKNQFKVSSHEI